jgi:hypothetical protein
MIKIWGIEVDRKNPDNKAVYKFVQESEHMERVGPLYILIVN